MRYLKEPWLHVALLLLPFVWASCTDARGERVPDPPPITFECAAEAYVWGMAFEGAASNGPDGVEVADGAVFAFRARGGCLAP